MKRLLSALLASFAKSPNSGRSPCRARRACPGVERLEARELMTAGIQPVGSGTVTQTYNPPKVAPAADPEPDSSITNFAATPVSGTQVNLSWSGGGGASGNYVCELIAGKWMEIGYTNDPSNSYAVTGLTPGTSYQFKVGCFPEFADPPGDLFYSNTLTATTPSPVAAPPATPVFAATAVSATQINLSWQKTAGASGYYVDEWVSTNGVGAWKTIATLGSTSTGYTFSSLSPHTTYYFTLGAFNSAGTKFAAYQSATTFTLTPPAVPAFTATAVSGTQVNLAWSAVANATGYLVDQWVNGAWKQVGTLNGSSTSFSANNLTAGGTYYFTVGASNAAGTTWAASRQVTTVVTTRTPAAPVFTATAVSTTQVSLSWLPVSGATGYVIDEWYQGAWKQIGTAGAGSTSFLANGLPQGTTLYFIVGAFNGAGTTWAANSQSATT
jgi:titin